MKLLYSSLIFISCFLPLYASAQITIDAGPDTGLCHKETLKIFPVVSGTYTSINYEWRNLKTSSVAGTSKDLSLVLSNTNSLAPDTVKFEFTVTADNSGIPYIKKDTVLVEVYPLPQIFLTAIPPRCYDDGDINLTNMLGWAKWLNFPNDFAVHYSSKNGWVTGGPYPAIQFYSYTKYTTTVPPNFRDSICGEYTAPHKYKCYNKECIRIIINPNPDVEIRPASACQRAGLMHLDILRKKPFNTIGGIQNWRCIAVPPGSGLDTASVVWNANPGGADFVLDLGTESDINRTGTYTVQYCFQNPSTGCRRCDTANIEVVSLPVINFISVSPQCINSPKLHLNNYVNLTNGRWSVIAFGGSRDKTIPGVANAINNAVTRDSIFNPGTGAGLYTLKFMHTESGCLSQDSIDIAVNGLPQVAVSAPDSVCSSADTVALVSNYGNNVNGVWTGTGVQGYDFIPGNTPKTKLYNGPFKLKYYYTNPVTKCTNSDSLYITVQSQSDVTISGADTQKFYFNTPKSLTAMLNYANAVSWHTNGSGTFNANTPATQYTYGASDTLAASVQLVASTPSVRLCPGASDTVWLVYAGIDLSAVNVIQDNDMLVYPVPASDKLYIEFKTLVPSAITLVNSMGQLVYKTTSVSGSHMKIPVTNLSEGVYYLLAFKDQDHYVKMISVD